MKKQLEYLIEKLELAKAKANEEGAPQSKLLIEEALEIASQPDPHG